MVDDFKEKGAVGALKDGAQNRICQDQWVESGRLNC